MESELTGLDVADLRRMGPTPAGSIRPPFRLRR